MPIKTKEDITDPLFILFFFSMLFGAELGKIGKLSHSILRQSEDFVIFSGNNILLIFIPFLAYSIAKKRSLLLKVAYSIGILSLIFHSSFFSTNINIYYINLVLSFAVCVCLLRFIITTQRTSY